MSAFIHYARKRRVLAGQRFTYQQRGIKGLRRFGRFLVAVATGLLMAVKAKSSRRKPAGIRWLGVAVALAATVLLAASSAAAQTRTLVLDDEFNGSTLDTSLWSYGWFSQLGQISGGSGSYEDDCYADSQTTLGGGLLTFMVIPQPSVCSGHTYDYTTGIITTMTQGGPYFGPDLFNFTYGTVEARIWLDAAANGQVANWPALWLKGQNTGSQGSTSYTEIDIMEGLGGNAAWHVHGLNGSTPCAGTPKQIMTGWHTFAVAWQPGTATFYYDGRQVGSTCRTPDLLAPNAENMQVILDDAVGLPVRPGYPSGSPGGPIKAPSQMQVDWVRIWQ